MKRTFILFAFTVSLFIYSCNQSSNKSSKESVDGAAFSTTCYTAVFEKDTAHLKIQTNTSGKITGDITINYGEVNPNTMEKPINIGNIEGSFSGDTLFVDYTHTTDSTSKKPFKNPLAFLKSGENLILGVGEVETYLGRSYFVKDKPINYEIARFTFIPADCEE